MKKTIYLAGGCFWGTEHLMSLVPGVTSTEVGYANSRIAQPSYQMVCTGLTGAAETVEVAYESEQIGLSDILFLYFRSIDPLSINRQGADAGTQYRTGIYYTDPADLPEIEAVVATVARQYAEPLAVEVAPLRNFYLAEDYHQDYLEKNPGGYCHVNPALFVEARTLAKGSAADKSALS